MPRRSMPSSPSTSSAGRTHHPQQQVGLLTKLPPELRTRVWVFVLSPAGSDGSVLLSRQNKQATGPENPTVLSLLAVCRTTHDKAAGIFYFRHQLRLRLYQLDLQPFVTGIGFSRRDSIRKLRLDVGRFELVTLACSSLRHMPRIAEVLFSFAGFYSTSDDYFEPKLKRECSITKKCGSKSLANIEIRLEFQQRAKSTETQEAMLKNFEQAILAA